MEYLIVFLYLIALLCIFLFSLGQLQLAWFYGKRKPSNQDDPQSVESWPKVTVQLPIYNERYVVERLLDAVCAFDYPQDKLEIQVLDDSTDETKAIVAHKVAQIKSLKDVNLKHITRPERSGFKAGALQYGLEICEGSFIAIFDADFLPEPDFLKDTIPHLSDPKIGLVQTRWGHVNKDYSILTKLQAFGLDAHFSVEQCGRSLAGSLINFNGTAGVWRKKCIEDSGGWSSDTLTEDLDLSYRAQMKGWKFKYLEDVVAPAELPVLMPAVKSQQFRWNKGAAETAKKNFWKIVRAPWSFRKKLHAIFHLFNSSVFVCLLVAAILSIPMLFIKNAHPEFRWMFNLGSVFLIGFFSIAYFYWVANQRIHPDQPWRSFLKTFPSFLTVSMGLSLHNTIAVLEGFIGRKSPFVRTPKFDIKHSKDYLRKNIYVVRKLSIGTLIEGALVLYFLFGIGAGLYLWDLGLMIFHVMLTLGFAVVFYESVKSVSYAE